MVGPGQWAIPPVVLKDRTIMDDIEKRGLELEKKIESINRPYTPDSKDKPKS